MRSLVTLVLLLASAAAVRADAFSLISARAQQAPPGLEVVPSGVRVGAKRGRLPMGVRFSPIGETLSSDPAETAMPTFRRRHETLTASWSVDVSAALRRTSWRGNAMFVFYDLADEHALDDDRYAALYQTHIGKSTELYAHAQLSPTGGFEPGHTYRMQIAQLIRGEKIVLAESDLRLE